MTVTTSKPRAMRILFLARYYYWWDRPRAGMLHLAMSPLKLQARGHEVRFLCERRPGQILDDDGLDVRAFTPGVPLDATALYESPFLKRHRLLRSALVRAGHAQYLASLWGHALAACRGWRPDLVYCQAEPPAPVAAALARRLRVPLVIHAYGGGSVTLDDARNPRWRAGRYLDTVYAYRANADAYLVVDDGTRGDQLARALGAPPETIHFWPIPVAPPSPPAVPSHRSRLGIPRDAPVVIAAARMVPIKRMDLCMDACAEALARRPEAHAILVGDGPERPAIEASAGRLPPDVRSRIHFTGYVERDTLSQLLQESSVFLTLQEVSVSGTNIRDAMIHGLCVVAVQRAGDAGLPGLLRDGENGRVLDEKDLGLAGTALENLLGDPAATRRLGEAGRGTAERVFETWDRRIDAEEALLLSLTSRSPRP